MGGWDGSGLGPMGVLGEKEYDGGEVKTCPECVGAFLFLGAGMGGGREAGYWGDCGEGAWDEVGDGGVVGGGYGTVCYQCGQFKEAASEVKEIQRTCRDCSKRAI